VLPLSSFRVFLVLLFRYACPALLPSLLPLFPPPQKKKKRVFLLRSSQTRAVWFLCSMMLPFSLIAALLATGFYACRAVPPSVLLNQQTSCLMRRAGVISAQSPAISFLLSGSVLKFRSSPEWLASLPLQLDTGRHLSISPEWTLFPVRDREFLSVNLVDAFVFLCEPSRPSRRGSHPLRCQRGGSVGNQLSFTINGQLSSFRRRLTPLDGQAAVAPPKSLQ